MTKNANLNPLEPDIHGTGYWSFRGKSLSPEDIERLKANGVDFSPYPDGDLMPDNRLKLPKFRKKWYKATIKEPTIAEDDLKHLQEKRWQKYMELPEPRPDYMEYAASLARRQQFDSLEELSLNAGRASDRLKAIQTILEFSKSKPKTQVELSENREEFFEMSPGDILRIACEVNGIDFQKLTQSVDTEKLKLPTQ